MATIRKTFGIAGDAYIEISRGVGAPLPATGAVIESSADRVPTEMLSDLIVQLRDEAVPTMKQGRVTMAEYQHLAAELRNPDGRLQQMLAHVERIGQSVERGDGLAGKIFMDPQMARQGQTALAKVNVSLDQIDAVLKDTRAAATSLATLSETQARELPELTRELKQTLAEAQTVLKDIGRTTERLPASVDTLDQTLKTLPALSVQTQETMRQIQRLVEAAEKHWLIQSYVEPEKTAGSRIRPQDISGR
jgi:phospholipid/cholesterol/gamma-HCH transport system substrate-binding protein